MIIQNQIGKIPVPRLAQPPTRGMKASKSPSKKKPGLALSGEGIGVYGDAIEPDLSERAVAGPGGRLLHEVEHLEAVDDLGEDGVVAVEVGLLA
jgi:hypothetical protein